MLTKKLRIAHLLPSMVFGGVEVAILKTHSYLNEEFDYEVFYVWKKGELEVGQKSVFNFLKKCLLKKDTFDLVITSLWWSHMIGLFVSMFGIKWVSFIHSTGSSSIVDYVVTWVALKFCNNIVFDSEATQLAFDGRYSGQSYIVPYIFKQDAIQKLVNKKPVYDLSWIGRNSKEKRLDLLVKLLFALQTYPVDFRCCVCVAGEKYRPLDDLAVVMGRKLSLNYNVAPEKISEIHYESKMIVCLSDYEGFSVTTAEAVLCGNFVAARKVGDLPNYLCGNNTVWLESLDGGPWDEFVEEIVHILGDENDCLFRRENSRAYTASKFMGRSYRESLSGIFKAVCNEK